MGALTLGYCGMNCGDCPVFIATAGNDDDLRQETAKEWSYLYRKFFKKTLRPQEMNCRGCRSSDPDLFACSRDCPIRQCCQERDLWSCAACSEYKTCDILNGFFTFNQRAKTNLEEMRTIDHDGEAANTGQETASQ